MRPLEVVLEIPKMKIHAIATTMQKLKYLKWLGYQFICSPLDHQTVDLDWTGCWDVELDEKDLMEKHPDRK